MQQQRSVSGLVGRTFELAPEAGHFVAECEELDLLGTVAASREDGELEQAADGEVDEGPQPAAHPVAPHLADSSRSRLDPESLLSDVFGVSDSTSSLKGLTIRSPA